MTRLWVTRDDVVGVGDDLLDDAWNAIVGVDGAKIQKMAGFLMLGRSRLLFARQSQSWGKVPLLRSKALPTWRPTSGLYGERQATGAQFEGRDPRKALASVLNPRRGGGSREQPHVSVGQQNRGCSLKTMEIAQRPEQCSLSPQMAGL